MSKTNRVVESDEEIIQNAKKPKELGEFRNYDMSLLEPAVVQERRVSSQ